MNKHAPMSREDIQRGIADLGEWFHNIDLDGVPTAPHHALGDYPRQRWARIAPALPVDLRGWTVLDIGCNAGFHSIEMKRRGADRVVGIDCDGRTLAQARFAAERLDVELELEQLSVYEVARLRERFDLVLVMGVLYHLRHPLLALDLIHEHVARNMVVVETKLRGNPAAPWWVPSGAGVEAMLRSAGFEILSHPEPEAFVCAYTDSPAGAQAAYAARGTD